MKGNNLLTILILAGLVAGAIFGQTVLYGSMGENPDAHWTKQAGDLFLIRPLFLLIIPLVFVSVVVGMTSIGDPSKLGVVGGSTLAYYLVTMLIACIIGAVLVTTFRPGDLPEETTAKLVGEADARTNPGAPGGGNIVIGRVVHIHLADGLVDERMHVDPDMLGAIGRMGGLGYCTTRDRFEMPMGRSAL